MSTGLQGYVHLGGERLSKAFFHRALSSQMRSNAFSFVWSGEGPLSVFGLKGELDVRLVRQNHDPECDDPA